MSSASIRAAVTSRNGTRLGIEHDRADVLADFGLQHPGADAAHTLRYAETVVELSDNHEHLLRAKATRGSRGNH